ncbi:MAG: PCRF domain-containing protein [Parcubacteria group bacterium]|nr:PCRF domain-containing protein [Parcubacteria group bacterium]
MTDKEEMRKQRIIALEAEMARPDFWQNKDEAQKKIREYNDLKAMAEGGGRYDKGDCIITLFSGAGGDDSEDFAAMLFKMYSKYVEKRGWVLNVLHKNENNRGGYKNLTFEVKGKSAYGTLKNESGVHRLVRISPFSAKKLRHTSFAMVEVVPHIEKDETLEIPEADIKVEFSKSGGPGGQNVNKRETAVRVVHIPTGMTVHVDTERNQAQNRARAIEVLKGRLYVKREKEREAEETGLRVSKTTEAEWGSQIRSYVLHPYQMVKDHRTEVKTSDTDAVLLRGEIDKFLDAEKNL